MRERQPFAFAALWENWNEPASGQWAPTFTILTTAPNPADAMTAWPVGTRVNKADNDDAAILDRGRGGGVRAHRHELGRALINRGA